jgi:hypothetical protein
MLPRSALAASAHETIEALEAELAEAETHLRNVLSKQPAAATPTSGGEACAQKCARLAAELERATMEFASRLHAEQVRAESVGRAGCSVCRSEDLGLGRAFHRPTQGLHAAAAAAKFGTRCGRGPIGSDGRGTARLAGWPRPNRQPAQTKQRDTRNKCHLPGSADGSGLFGLCRPRPRGCAMSSLWRS